MIAVFLLTGCGSTQEAADTENTPVTEENAFPEEMYAESYVVEDALAEQMVPLAGAPVRQIPQLYSLWRMRSAD